MTDAGVEVPCIPIVQSPTGYYNTYAWAANLGTDFEIGSPIKYLAKGRDGLYKEVYSHSTASATFSTGTAGAVAIHTDGLTEFGAKYTYSGSDYAIISGGRWSFKGQNNAGLSSPAGKLTFRLYTSPDLDKATPIASATVEKSNYFTQLKAANPFWVNFQFDKPFVFGKSYKGAPDESGLYLTLVMDKYTGNSTTDFVSNGPTGNGTIIKRISTGSVFSETTDAAPYTELFAAQFTVTVGAIIDKLGYGANEMAVTMAAGMESSFNDLSLSVTTLGLGDDVSGGLGGVARATLKYPHHITEALLKSYNGSAWVDPNLYDDTAFTTEQAAVFATSHPLYRQVAGATTGQTSLEDVLGAIMRQSSCKLVQRNNGKLGVWPWGTTETVVQTYTDEDIKVISWQRLDASSVINSVSIQYGAGSIQYQGDQVTEGQDLKTYYSTLQLPAADDSLSTELAARSQAIYGVKVNEEDSLRFIGDRQTARTYAYQLMEVYDHPHVIVEFLIVDFWAARTLELLDVIQIKSPDLPCFYGTSGDAERPTYGGTTVQLNPGQYWKRSETYRCQIVGKQFSWAYGETPTFRVTARIIKPYHDYDPT